MVWEGVRDGVVPPISQLRISHSHMKGLRAPSGPPGTQPTPAQGFLQAESERGKAFPVPVRASA